MGKNDNQRPGSKWRKLWSYKHHSDNFKWVVYCVLYLLFCVVLWHLALIKIPMSYITQDHFKTPALYFFSAVAQTMGALLAITFTVFYISVQNFYKRDIQKVNDKENKTIQYLREVAFEPLKRIMLNDKHLIVGISSGVLSIFLSIVGILVIYIHYFNPRTFLFVIVVLSPVVFLGIVSSLSNTMKFIRNRFGYYTNPITYILTKDVEERRNIFSSRDFVNEFEIAILTNVLNGESKGQSKNLIVCSMEEIKNDQESYSIIAKNIASDIGKIILNYNERSEVSKEIIERLFAEVESFGYQTKEVNTANGATFDHYYIFEYFSRLIVNVCRGSDTFPENHKTLKERTEEITLQDENKPSNKPYPYLFKYHILKNFGVQPYKLIRIDEILPKYSLGVIDMVIGGKFDLENITRNDKIDFCCIFLQDIFLSYFRQLTSRISDANVAFNFQKTLLPDITEIKKIKKNYKECYKKYNLDIFEKYINPIKFSILAYVSSTSMHIRGWILPYIDAIFFFVTGVDIRLSQMDLRMLHLEKKNIDSQNYKIPEILTFLNEYINQD